MDTDGTCSAKHGADQPTEGEDPLITGGTVWRLRNRCAPMTQLLQVYSMGRMLLQEGQALEAETLILRALDIFQQARAPPRHSCVTRADPRPQAPAHCLHADHAGQVGGCTVGMAATLCSCYMSQGDKQRAAVSQLERAIHIMSKELGAQHPDLAEPGGPLLLKAKARASSTIRRVISGTI